MFELRESPLDVSACCAAVARPGAGGTVVFVGTVRDHNQGKPVHLLEYQAYRSMAAKEMARIADELRKEFPGIELACQHRVGALSVGDLAVVCAASAAHREQAFQACRAWIDRVKDRVPIWKREHGPDGPYWVGWQDAFTTVVDEGD